MRQAVTGTLLLVLLCPVHGASVCASPSDPGGVLVGVVRDGEVPVAARVVVSPLPTFAWDDSQALMHEANRLGALLFVIGALEPPVASEGQARATRAGPDGKFRLAGLPEGDYEVAARMKDGRRGSARVHVPIDGAVIPAEVVLGTPTTRIVRGRIRYASGKPYIGRVVPMRFPMVAMMGGLGVETDAQGRFTLETSQGATDGDPWIATLRPRRSSVAWPVPADAGSLDLVIDQDTRQIAGVAVDDVSGDPVSGAVLYLNSATESRPRRYARAVTDEKGRFRFPLGPKGPASLIALSPKHGHVSRVVHTQSRVELRLPRAAHISGRIQPLPKGGVPPGLEIHAWLSVRGSWPSHLTCPVGADGGFDFGAFPPSRALLYAIAPGWLSTGLGAFVREAEHDLPRFDLSPGDAKTVRMQLQRAGSVEGRVLDEAGKPLAGAVVRLHVRQDGVESVGGRPPGSTHREEQMACTDRTGAFKIRTLLPGVPYELLVSRAGYAYAQSGLVRAGPGETVHMEVRVKRK